MGHGRHHMKANSRVKVIHNVANGPVVDVVLDGNKALSNVEYKVQSDYLVVPSGKHSVNISAGGKVLASANVDLAPNEDYTVIAHGDVKDLSSLALLALKDNNACPARGKAHLRFVHAAAGAPAVDIWAGNNRVFQNVSYGNTGSPTYLPVDAGTVDVSVTPAGSTDRVLGPISLTLGNGKIYTVTASGIVGDSESPLTALVHEDRMCSVHQHHHHNHHHDHYYSSGNKKNSAMMGLWMNL